MAKRKRVDEFELPAALGEAVVTYYGRRRFAKFTPEQKADIANACNDCARTLQAILTEDDELRKQRLASTRAAQ